MWRIIQQQFQKQIVAWYRCSKYSNLNSNLQQDVSNVLVSASSSLLQLLPPTSVPPVSHCSFLLTSAACPALLRSLTSSSFSPWSSKTWGREKFITVPCADWVGDSSLISQTYLHTRQLLDWSPNFVFSGLLRVGYIFITGVVVLFSSSVYSGSSSHERISMYLILAQHSA